MRRYKQVPEHRERAKIVRKIWEKKNAVRLKEYRRNYRRRNTARINAYWRMKRLQRKSL